MRTGRGVRADFLSAVFAEDHCHSTLCWLANHLTDRSPSNARVMADDAIGRKKADRAVSYAIAARGGPHGCNQAKGPNVACHKALAKADGTRSRLRVDLRAAETG